MSQAVRLTPSLREKVWGKTQLEPWFPNSPAPVGEAWFLADHELPLLIKLLFTSERLSVQVHPKDGEDGPRGKTEMWHILHAEPGATIALGFRQPVTREQLRESTRSGAIEELLNWAPVHAGETYFTPAHTVHAIGAGIVLCEIQQNSDVTYRLWDYGRPRELHIDQGVAVSDLVPHAGMAQPQPIGAGHESLVRSDYFVTELVSGVHLTPDVQTCQIWICIEGSGSIGGQAVRAGEAWLFPDGTAQPVDAENARFLRTYVPASTI